MTTPHPAYWSIAERFSYEFGSTINHLRKFQGAYYVGAGIFVLMVTAVTWARTDTSWADLPIIFLASVIHLLRGAAIVSLFFAWMSAKIVQDWLYSRTSNAWVRREAARMPGLSFPVPHWRFYLPAATVRFAMFGTWLGSLFYLLFVITNRIQGLERLIPDNFPF